jgi:hypothetical protein
MARSVTLLKENSRTANGNLPRIAACDDQNEARFWRSSLSMHGVVGELPVL